MEIPWLQFQSKLAAQVSYKYKIAKRWKIEVDIEKIEKAREILSKEGKDKDNEGKRVISIFYFDQLSKSFLLQKYLYFFLVSSFGHFFLPKIGPPIIEEIVDLAQQV